MPSITSTTFLLGTLQTVSANFTNPYTGDVLEVDGDYYVNDTFLDGGPGVCDLLLSGSENQFFRLTDDSGNLLFANFEMFIPGSGSDILLLADTTHILGDLDLRGSSEGDVIWSNAGNDYIEGNQGDDILHGGPGHDTILGGDHDDTLTGASGDDTLDGEAGFDTAIYYGNFSDYVLTDTAGTLTVQDTAGSDGTDTLTSVEKLVFADGVYENGFFTPDTPALTFTDSDFASYTRQDDAAAVLSVTGDSELNLSGNAWKALDFDYTVTKDSYVTLEYKTVSDAEIQGLIFLREELQPSDKSVSNLHEEAEFIRLDGSQLYNGSENLYTEDNGTWQTITIRLSDYNAVGSDIGHLVFVNDDDAGIGAQSAFRNVRVFESGTAPPLPSAPANAPVTEFAESDFASYTRQDDAAATATVTGNTEVALSGNAWKALDFDYTVTKDSYVTLEYKTVADGEVQGLVFLRDGLDPADMSVNNLHKEVEFIRLDGDQAYNGTENLYTEPNGTWQTITIRLADYNAAGSDIGHLVFVNDDDAGTGAQNAFRNVQVFESNGIYGDASANVITGTSATDYLYGGGGDDTFLFDALNAFDQVDVIADFNTGDNDALDVSDLLSGYDPLTDLITDFVQITDNGVDSLIAVDADGGGDNFAAIATLQGVTGLTDEAALETAGNLVTV